MCTCMRMRACVRVRACVRACACACVRARVSRSLSPSNFLANHPPSPYCLPQPRGARARALSLFLSFSPLSLSLLSLPPSLPPPLLPAKTPAAPKPNTKHQGLNPTLNRKPCTCTFSPLDPHLTPNPILLEGGHE